MVVCLPSHSFYVYRAFLAMQLLCSEGVFFWGFVPHFKVTLKSHQTEKLSSLNLLHSQYRTCDGCFIIGHFSRETLKLFKHKNDVLYRFFSASRSVHTVGLVSGAGLCVNINSNSSPILEGTAAITLLWTWACFKHTHRNEFPLLAFPSLSFFFFFWYVTRLCYSVGSSRQFQWVECCIHMWSVAPEITTCTSYGSMDSVTCGVLWSKELSFLDMFKNSAFGPILGWMKRCFWYLSRLRALGYFFSPSAFSEVPELEYIFSSVCCFKGSPRICGHYFPFQLELN